MKNLFKNILIFLIFFFIIAGLFSTRNISTEKSFTINIQKMIEQIDQGLIKKIEIENEKLNITLTDNQKETVYKESNESLSALLKNYNVDSSKLKKISIEVKEKSGFAQFANVVLPFLFPFLLIGLVFYIIMRQIQGVNTKAMMFGESRARETSKNKKDRITFKDVAGVKEAKEELYEVVEFLKNPKKFTDLGAKIPKGALLLGPPGVGKTLLAKAVAGESKVPFYSLSGSEFVEMFVGVGASRVRSLFQKAKKTAPCIIFIDELDAVGRQRGAGLGGSHDEREQTLNQILVEMDGFDPSAGIVILAATNRPDVLDPALLRPGRFDRRVVLDLPDIKDREDILNIHAKNKPIDKTVSLKRVAERTPGLSGADLANVLNEAAILAARRDKKQIGIDELFESIEKVILGPERKSRLLSKKEKKITAYHEAGHALTAHFLPYADPVHKVSIISRGQAAGYTLKLPLEDKHFYSRKEFIDDLAVLLAGYAAEKIIFNDLTTGASNDLKQATKLAKKLITQYGMSSLLAPRTYGEKEELIFLGKEIHEQRDYSEKTAEAIDEEMSRLIKEAELTAENIIRKQKKYLNKIAKLLLEKEVLEREEFLAIFKNKEKEEV